MNERFAIVGLGSIGLQVALAFGKKYPAVVAYDSDATRVAELRRGLDRHHEQALGAQASGLTFTSEPAELRGCTFFVVTPVDDSGPQDLSPIEAASSTVGRALSRGSIVVFEPTVYPGVTEEVCAPILARESGLQRGVDFKVGYSPDRVNPGDETHSFENVIKVVSGEDADALERIAAAYSGVVRAGLYRAPSIKVAEAAKVIENTQRDLNIALVNELAIVFDRIGVRTADVLAAAATKWNFLDFRPGLVGGHRLGVDPYLLSMKAQQLGYQPEVIAAGRRINDKVAPYVAQKLVKLLAEAGRPVKGARVGILGATFKEDCNDLRTSKVPELRRELKQFGIEPLLHDPLVEPADALREHAMRLTALEELTQLDGLILAVPHKKYRDMGQGKLTEMLREGGVLVDVKSVLDPATMRRGIRYWSL
jgi:UDP-N-acetyl-D-galactosamine dehydrogenase